MQKIRALNPYTRVLYTLNTISWIAGSVYGLYYGIFLYKQTFSLSVLAVDGLLGGFGAYLGYVLGAVLIRRLGYAWCIRLAFGLWGVISLLTAMVAPHIADWYMLLAVIKTLPSGLYTATADTIMLRDIKSGSRSRLLQMNLAIEFLVGIILPGAVGALIHWAGGYRLSFALAGIMYLAALFVPIRLPKPTVHMDIREMLQIFRRPLYPLHAANRTAAAGFNQLNAFVTMIIPFLLLKNELKVGMFTSAAAIVAVIVSFMMRQVKVHHTMKLGYGAYAARAVSSLAFIMSWSPLSLMVWQLINKVVTPLHDPLQQSLDIHNDSLIMGEGVRRQALQINLLNNTLLLAGSTLAYGGFFLLNHAAGGRQQTILSFLIAGYAAWRFANLAISAWVNKRVRHPASRHLPAFDLMAVYVTLKRLMNMQLTKILYLFAT